MQTQERGSLQRGEAPPVPPRRRSRRGSSAAEPQAAYAEWFTSYTKPSAPSQPQLPAERLRQYRHAFNRFPTLLALHTAMSKRLEQLGALQLTPSTANFPPAAMQPEAPPFLSFVQILAMKEQQGLPLEDDPVQKLLPTSRAHRGKSMQFESARKRLQRRAKMGTVSMGAAEVNALLWDSSDSDVDDDDDERRPIVHKPRKSKGPRPESLRMIVELLERDRENAQRENEQTAEDDEGGDGEDDDDEDDVQLRASFLVRTDRHIMGLEPQLLTLPVSAPDDQIPCETLDGTPRVSFNSEYILNPTCSYDDDIPDAPVGAAVIVTQTTKEDEQQQQQQQHDEEEQVEAQPIVHDPQLLFVKADLDLKSLTESDDAVQLSVDPSRRESQLTVDEFVSVFGMSRDEFYALPEWKQRMLKQERDLF